MQIQLDVRLLIDLARQKSGMSFGEMAKDLDRSQSRISEWRSGRVKPDANEIAYFAAKAGLPVLQTVAEIEAQLDDRYASIWREALGKLTAAGVTAAVIVTSSLHPAPANATTTVVKQGLYIMSTQAACLVASLFRQSVVEICPRPSALRVARADPWKH